MLIFRFCTRSCLLLAIGAVALAGCGAAVPGGFDDFGADGSDGSQDMDGSGSDNGSDSGSGDGSGTDGGSGSANGVDDSLQQLGVNTEPTARVAETNEELPDSYSPLGSQCDVAKTDELFLVGLQVNVTTPTGEEEALPQRAVIAELADDDTGVVGLGITDVFGPELVWEEDEDSSHPGMNGGIGGNQSTRAAVAADLDGDGLDELVIVYIDPAAPARAGQLLYDVIYGAIDEDSPDATRRLEGPTVLTDRSDIEGIELEAGDFDGDGFTDIAIGLSFDTQSEILFAFADDAGVLSVDESATKTFAQFITNSGLSLSMAAGNIDFDNGHELAVVVNEFDSSNRSGSASYWIFDDGRNFFDPLVSDQAVIIQDGGVKAAVVANVAMGDIDADGRDEIVFAGLDEFLNNGCDAYGHIHLALDDAVAETNALRSIGARYISEPYFESGTGCNSNSHQMRVRKVHINTFDVDGDDIDEIHAGRRVFEDFTQAEPWTEAGDDNGLYILPFDEWVKEPQTVGGTLSDATTQMVTADVTGDGRENIISYMQWRSEISIWGLEGPGEDTLEWTKVATITTPFTNGQARVYPLIVPCNVDKDGLALRYSEGEHRFVFTEPILIAALAAAPCAEGIGQNLDACVTAYGQSESQMGGLEGTVTVRASEFVSVEGKDPFFGIGGRAESRVTTTASFSAGRAYSLEETIEYTTGSLEDTVIFTTIPLDQYTYSIISHPDPTLEGTEVVINMPRTPITLQVEREFYNEQVVDGALTIGSNIFLHTVGDVDSYPTRGDAEALIDTGGLGHLGPLGELVDAAGEALGPIAERLLGNGLISSRSTTVGQGGGQTSTEIRFSEQTTYAAGAEIDYEQEFAVSGGGVSVGGSIGGSVGATVSWGTASSTIYRGTVGSIDGENFSGNVYSFGIFTYIYNYGDSTKPQFEVLNYYVER